MNWRWADDDWDSKVTGHGPFTYDKPIHFTISFIATLIGFFICTWLHFPLIYSPLLILLLGALWEVKDALYPYETAGSLKLGSLNINLGGDGFSWKDVVADVLGILLVVGLFLTFSIFLN